MSDPLVKTVTGDDGTERYVAAGGPSDTDAVEQVGVATVPAKQADAVDPNDPDVDQPAKLVTEEAPDAATPDAAAGDGPDARRGKRRS
jgi:hypothetical protein